MDMQRSLRGHAFLPPKKVLDEAPAAYATEDIAAEDKTIIAHYFNGGADYYIAEMWQEPGGEREADRWMAFGYARLASHPEGQEWGYLDLDELEQVRGRTSQGLPVIVERDLHWDPAPFSQIKGVEHPAEARGPQPGIDSVVNPETRAGAVAEPGAELAGRPGGEPGGTAPQMQCPECEEAAVNHPATDRVPWEAHGLDRPEWSHTDGSALCPVIGTSGSYVPAQPSTRRIAPKPEHRARGTAGSYACRATSSRRGLRTRGGVREQQMTDITGDRPVERLAYSVDEAAAITGLSRDLLYDQMRTGKLAYLKIGRRRIITRQDLEAFLSRNAS